MSSKETRVDERSEGYVENTPELAIASSAINSKNGESTVDIDNLEEDSKPAAPPSGSPIRTQDHQVYHVLTVLTEDEIRKNFGEEMPEKFKSLDQALDTKEGSKSKIEKAPSIVHKNTDFVKYFKPKKVSIGPYHHNELKETESLKLKFARLFINKNGLKVDEPYSKIKEKIKKLKEYYEEEAVEAFGDNALAWMFLVDGCTILCYIYYVTRIDEQTLTEHLRTKVGRLTLLKHDLLLLENQLPYEVLDLIMSCLGENKANDMKNAINEFIFDRMKGPGENYVHPLNSENEAPVHLLDLFRKRLLHPVEKDQNSCYNVQQLMKKMVKVISDPLDTIRDCIEFIGTAFEKPPQKGRKNLHFFRNIAELKAVGIRYKAINTVSLRSVDFSCGTLKLPSFRVDKSTISKFLNLAAYEMCPSSKSEFSICSFIVFLDTFIDQAQDVKELRKKKILHNALGSDEEVAELFNEVSTNLQSNAKIYARVNIAIQRRYENKLVTWIAQLIHQHFHSPWSLIAFLAAIIAITSSVVQTAYTILGFYAGRS